MARCHLEGHELAFVVDAQMELDAKELAHGGATTLGQIWEDPVTADAGVMTDRQLGAVGKVDVGLLCTERKKEQVKGQQEVGLQAHKPALTGEWSQAGPALLCEAIAPEMLEVLVGRDVKQHQDGEHLGEGELAASDGLMH